MRHLDWMVRGVLIVLLVLTGSVGLVALAQPAPGSAPLSQLSTFSILLSNPPAPGSIPGRASGTTAQDLSDADETQPLIFDGVAEFSLDNLLENLSLTGKQAANLKPEFDTLNAAVRSWENKHAAELTDFEQALADVGDSRDAQILEDVYHRFRALLAERTRLVAEHKKSILALLTSAQKVQWEAVKIRATVDRRLTDIDLTDEQDGTIDALADKAAQEIGRLPEPRDPAVVTKITRGVWQIVHDSVLTKDQRRQVDHPDANADDPENLPKKMTAAATMPRMAVY